MLVLEVLRPLEFNVKPYEQENIHSCLDQEQCEELEVHPILALLADGIHLYGRISNIVQYFFIR